MSSYRTRATRLPIIGIVVGITMLGALLAPPAGAQESFDEVRATDSYTNDTAAVMRLYRAFFDREPDAEGASYWMNVANHGSSLDTIAWSFAASDEFINTYGAELSNAQFVTIVYQNVLDREPDIEGLGYWLERMAAGLTRSGVVRWFTANPEFINSYPYEPLGGGFGGSAGYATGLWTDDDGLDNYLRIDLNTGVGTRILPENFAHGLNLGRLEVHPAGREGYVHQYDENPAASCAAAVPMLKRLRLGDGSLKEMGAGAQPMVSPDGRHLAYLDASGCVTAPAEVSAGAGVYAAPLDTVVVLDILTGVERRLVFPDVLTEVQAMADNSALMWEPDEAQLSGPAWVGNEAVMVGDQQVSLGTELTASAVGWELSNDDLVVGFANGSIMAQTKDSTGATLVAIDPTSGGRTVARTAAPPSQIGAAFDVNAEGNLIAIDGELIQPQGYSFFELPEGLLSIGW